MTADDRTRGAIIAERNARRFEEGGLSAAAAAAIIVGGVRRRRWRILVGEDARRLDAAVRAAPEAAYDAKGLVYPAGQRDHAAGEGGEGGGETSSQGEVVAAETARL